MHRRTLPLSLLVCLVLFFPQKSQAQDGVRLGGETFIDYEWIGSHPTAASEGQHGFTFRRVYFTTDYRISDAFSARFRLEASDALLSGRGALPFVKDLYLNWESEQGHAVTGGIAPVPVFRVAEGVWGYRSLERTIMDLHGIVSSRDFGLHVSGPITGDNRLRYALMYGNNSSTRPYEGNRRKRLYGQLEAYPTEHLVITIGGDYGGYFRDQISTGWQGNGFVGYVTPAFRVGLESFWQRLYVDEQIADVEHVNDRGSSLFGAIRLHDNWEAVARVDLSQHEAPTSTQSVRRTLALAGITYQPHEQVRLIPNLRYLKDENVDADIRGRITVHVVF